ncbi:hypothetical protein GCM10009555_087240 [Acrocarpospora macrocephala]|uniref:Peptidase C14 caspase domain-containing protein n=2 Tax=Acrocarpospora macrocephala TaxID=150177 RepID=A0A5M3WLD1_9ACTN|nr:hypothetical protein Amac_024380 [Acrocarpospora macrocephala]
MTYADPAFSGLRAPAEDAVNLADVLGDPEIGGFSVSSLVDRSAQDIRRSIDDLLSSCGLDDLLLLYLSCHGVLDARGRLYFAATDTHKSHLASTGIESSWLLDQLDECRARRQVLILDCCFSGAFAGRAKGETEIDLRRHLVGHGRGRAVLTASRAGEYSFEGEPLDQGATGSVFTTGLIEGIRSGSADQDKDGYISVEDSYDYAYKYVQRHGAAQTPQRWLFGAEGSIYLARNPVGIPITPIKLPDALYSALTNPYPEVRVGAINVLAGWLLSGDPEQMYTARKELEQISSTDIAKVASVAQSILADSEQQAGSELSAQLSETEDLLRERQRQVEELSRQRDSISDHLGQLRALLNEEPNEAAAITPQNESDWWRD